MTRLLGLLLIVRAFTPALIVLVIVWAAGRFVGDLQAAAAPPIAAMETHFADLGAAVETARAAFDDAKSDVDAALSRLADFRLPSLLPNLPLNLTFPTIPIPDLTFNLPSSISVQWESVSFDVREVIPRDCGIFDFVCQALGDIINIITRTVQYPAGLTIGTTPFSLSIPDIPAFNLPTPPFFRDLVNGIDGLFSPIRNIFDRLDAAMRRFSQLGQTLQAVPEAVNRVAENGQALLTQLTRALVTWGGVVTALALIVAALIIIGYAVTFIELLRRGLRLLLTGA